MPPASITMSNGRLNVPAEPIIPFIEGDGTGPDIWSASVRVFDAAVAKASNSKNRIHWKEVYAGEKSFNKFKDTLGETAAWLPEDTLAAFRTHLVGIKGPLTTPTGGGIRSLNVALRQQLDLYVCLRPVRWFKGVPSPVKRPGDCDMVIFRENTEDIYAGIEAAAGTPESAKLLAFLQEHFPKEFSKIRFGTQKAAADWQRSLESIGMTTRDASKPPLAAESTPALGFVGLGIKPVSYLGTERLVHSAISYALKHKRKSVTLVHKGNIMKFTEGAFKDWGYKIATTPAPGGFRPHVVTERESWILGNKESSPDLSPEANARMIDPGFDMMTPAQQDKIVKEVTSVLATIWPTHGDQKWKKMLLIKDSIADITLQQVLTRPKDFDVIATLNLNGDYLSDALAAQVGGIGIAPGGNINYLTGHAIFEATHGTAPKYANLDQVNPGSVILSGEMMLRYMGSAESAATGKSVWTDAADLIIKGMDGAISAKTVTYDFERLMKAEGDTAVTKVKCSEFADAVIKAMV